jgi:ribonuclease Z
VHTTNGLNYDQNRKVCYKFMGIPNERATRRLKINGNNIELETVGADHSVPTVVYGISLVRQKLNEKYAGMPQRELVQLKKNGTNITCEVIDRKFCYVLDSSINVLEENSFLLEYPTIIIECTFLFDDEVQHAIDRKHIHWLQLKPYVLKYSDKLFILTHFSLRYKDHEIKSFFDSVREGEQITNIHPWLTDDVD